MHELSIAENIVEIIRENAGDHHDVKRVRVRIGELAGVVPDSLEFCFGAITSGTPLGQTILEIESVGIVGRCRACGIESEIRDLLFECPGCRGGDLDIISGNDLKVVEIEVDDGVCESK